MSPSGGTDEGAAAVAVGTPLREALDALVAARLGALVTVGDEIGVAALADGGFRLDAPFTPQALYELCKMDGAVTLDATCSRIVMANAHLVPDRRLPTAETGIRHRTAQQLSLATGATVIAVSRRRGSVTVFVRQASGRAAWLTPPLACGSRCRYIACASIWASSYHPSSGAFGFGHVKGGDDAAALSAA